MNEWNEIGENANVTFSKMCKFETGSERWRECVRVGKWYRMIVERIGFVFIVASNLSVSGKVKKMFTN